MIKKLYMISLIALFVISVSGCGGSGGRHAMSPASQGFGGARFSIEWPRETRLIPNATRSIHIYIKLVDTVVASKGIDRPSIGGHQTVEFEDLPAGRLEITVRAYPYGHDDCPPPPGTPFSTAPLASATAPLLIQADQTTNINITMVSTIDHIELTSDKDIVEIGKTAFLTATAKNAIGEIVLLSGNKLQWISSNTSRVSVDAGGKVTGISEGVVEVTVTDTESGKSASIPISVVSASSN